MPQSSRGKTRIIIIDKSSEFADAVSKILGNHEFDFYHASSSIKALDSVMVFIPNLIILDISEKPEDSLSFIKYFKRYPEYAQAPILLTGSKPKEAIIKSAIALGVSDFIQKPIHNQNLLSKIKKLLLNSKQRDIKTISPYETIGSVDIKPSRQLENLLAFEAPIRIRGRQQFSIKFENHKVLYAASLESENIFSKNNLYRNILAFDPLEGSSLIRPLKDLNFIYQLEDVLINDRPSLLVVGSDIKGLDILKIFFKKFNATYVLSKDVLNNTQKSFKAYDAIFFGFSGEKEDIEQLNHIKKYRSENTSIIVALSLKERRIVPVDLVTDCVVVPKPFNRNNVLLNLARIIRPEAIKNELMKQSQVTSHLKAKIEFPLTIVGVEERGLILESPLLIQKDQIIEIALVGGLKDESLNNISVIVRDVEYINDLKSYRILSTFQSEGIYKRANIIYHLHSN